MHNPQPPIGQIFLFQLGEKVKDVLTGFIGIIVCQARWLNGCVKYGVQGVLKKDGVVPDPQWIDEGQLNFLLTSADRFKGKRAPTGGPAPTPKEFSKPE